MGRPLKNAEEKEGVVDDNDIRRETAVKALSPEVDAEVNPKYYNADKEEIKAPRKIEQITFLPYEGKNKLPKAEIKYKTHKGITRFVLVRAGEPRYFVRRCPNEVYKLVKVFSNGRGTAQRHVMTLKPAIKGEKGRVHRNILKRLRKSDIPGA